MTRKFHVHAIGDEYHRGLTRRQRERRRWAKRTARRLLAAILGAMIGLYIISSIRL